MFFDKWSLFALLKQLNVLTLSIKDFGPDAGRYGIGAVGHSAKNASVVEPSVSS